MNPVFEQLCLAVERLGVPILIIVVCLYLVLDGWKFVKTVIAAKLQKHNDETEQLRVVIFELKECITKGVDVTERLYSDMREIRGFTSDLRARLLARG